MRLRQLFAHVIVTTSDEQSGEVAMGVRAQVGGWLGPLEGHVLSLLIGIPLLGALLTIIVRALGRRDDKTPHTIALLSLFPRSAFSVELYDNFLRTNQPPYSFNPYNFNRHTNVFGSRFRYAPGGQRLPLWLIIA